MKNLGGKGLVSVSENAVLNSNYLKEMLKNDFELPYDDLRKHEFVLSGKPLKAKGLRTVDFAKRLLDYGFHAPTVYFPVIVDEAIMIEPTETESKDTLDAFVAACRAIMREDPELLHTAPHNTARRRLDEAKAAREMIFSWREFESRSAQKPTGA
jgi:glycine dehydrogenase subunit 2